MFSECYKSRPDVVDSLEALLGVVLPSIVVSTAWLETLLSAISALPKETIKQEVSS